MNIGLNLLRMFLHMSFGMKICSQNLKIHSQVFFNFCLTEMTVWSGAELRR